MDRTDRSIGTTHEQYINFVKDRTDGTAEALYTLIDAPSAASFSVQSRHMGGDKQVTIHYHDTLSSVNNPLGSKIDLGFQKDGGVSFILSGSGPSFVSSNPPTGWMQSSLSSIGSKSLREIAMPASHNSGMNKLTHHYGGVEHNTLTQSLGVYAQAENGVRYFDIRPVIRQGKFYAGHFSRVNGHFSKLVGNFVGGTGSTIHDIVRDINAFNSAFPGELLVLDISHDLNIDGNFRHFSELEWLELYGILDGITDLWIPQASLPHVLSNRPLSAFITPGSRSATIVRLPLHAAWPISQQGYAAVEVKIDDHSGNRFDNGIGNGNGNGNGNGKSQGKGKGLMGLFSKSKKEDPSPLLIELAPPPVTGILHAASFIPDEWFPVVNRYSNTNKPTQLAADQIRKMREHKSSEDGMLMGAWTLTENLQHSLDVANPKHSIIGDAVQAHRRLFNDLWPAMSKENHPNLVQVDDIHSKEVLALTMAINNNFVAPPQLSRRDAFAAEAPQSPASEPERMPCSAFDRWAHWWNFYPKDKCYNPHPFQNLAKNAQELAREWRDNERANEHARLNDTAAMLKDEEEWLSRKMASMATLTTVRPSGVKTTANAVSKTKTMDSMVADAPKTIS